MIKATLLTLTLAFSLASAQTVLFEPGESLPPGEYDVFRILDGDTITVIADGVERSVRFVAINTPELRPLQPYAVEAKELAIALLAGERVKLEQGEQLIDHHGRAVAYVYLDGRDVSLLMAQAGYAALDVRYLGGERTALYAFGLQGAYSVGKGRWKDYYTNFADRNCSDFRRQQEAQAFFEGAQAAKQRDRHRLDPDRDGVACQSLPKR